MSHFADPFGMRLKQGKHLLVMRNTFTPEHPPINLVDLPTGMFHKIIQYAEPSHGEMVVRADLLAGVVRSGQIPLRQVQVGSMGIFNLLLFLLLFAFVFGRGVLKPLYFAVLPFELTLVVLVLPPSRQFVGGGQFSTDFDDLADGVQEQVDIGGKMDVCLHHKGITTAYAPLFRFFFNALCPAPTITRLSRSRISGVNSRKLSLRVCRL